MENKMIMVFIARKYWDWELKLKPKKLNIYMEDEGWLH